MAEALEPRNPAQDLTRALMSGLERARIVWEGDPARFAQDAGEGCP